MIAIDLGARDASISRWTATEMAVRRAADGSRPRAKYHARLALALHAHGDERQRGAVLA